MSDVIDPEGFRANVGIVADARRAARCFWAAARAGAAGSFRRAACARAKQLEEALFRELHEEVGLHARGCRARRQHGELAALPPAARDTSAAIGARVCIGQKQRWFLLRLKREDVQLRFR